MTQNRRLTWQAVFFGLIVSGMFSPAVLAQESPVQYRSRAEYLTEQRKVVQVYPELVRALRMLQLSSDKIAEAKTKLKRHEVSTRAVRQELQVLDEENQRQGYTRQTLRSAAADELRGSLQRSNDQLHSELKNLLTPQQREQFDRYLQQQTRHRIGKSRSFR